MEERGAGDGNVERGGERDMDVGVWSFGWERGGEEVG